MRWKKNNVMAKSNVIAREQGDRSNPGSLGRTGLPRRDVVTPRNDGVSLSLRPPARPEGPLDVDPPHEFMPDRVPVVQNAVFSARKIRRGCLLLATALFTTTALAGMQPTPMHRIAPHYNAKHTHSVTMHSGSLRRNLSRVAKQYGWKKVVWLSKSDYQWVGQVTIREKNAYSLFERVLQEYPLQAVFYKGNHVLVIRPRNV